MNDLATALTINVDELSDDAQTAYHMAGDCGGPALDKIDPADPIEIAACVFGGVMNNDDINIEGTEHVTVWDADDAMAVYLDDPETGYLQIDDDVNHKTFGIITELMIANNNMKSA